MKKIYSCILVLFLVLLTACGNSSDSPDKTSEENIVLEENNTDENSDVVEEEVEVEEEKELVLDEDDLLITFPQEAVNPGETFTGLPPKECVEFVLNDYNNTRGLSTEAISHSYGIAKDGQPHQITLDCQQRFNEWNLNALAWDNQTHDKVLYLTFDCGYEYENLTGKILDTLNEKNVEGTFFCTMDYLKDAPEFAARMINEGHMLANHSTTHPSNSAELTREELAKEILGVHNYVRVNFGYDCTYFRFPTGTYSQNALDVVSCLGYRSIFWSIAHADWDPQNQPGEDVTLNTLKSRLHPGSVILLHACSPDNAAVLGEFIDYAEENGYVFRSLDNYAYWTN